MKITDVDVLKFVDSTRTHDSRWGYGFYGK